MPKRDKHSQKVKFQELARSLEASDSEAAFDAALKRIAKAPISKPVKKARKSAN